MDKNVLVTGATGFIGPHAVRALLRCGYQVHILIRPSSDLSALGECANKIVVHSADITNREAVIATVKDIAPAHIFHLATSTIMSGKTADAKTLLVTNVEGTINLMDAAARLGVSSFINMGSFLEYGPKNHSVTEDERCDPVELYAVTKLATTLYGQGLARRTDFPCITFRLFTPYGPGIQKGRLVRTLIEKVRDGEEVPLVKRSIARDFIYVEDIPALLTEAATHARAHAGEIFNLGSGTHTTMQELVRRVEDAVGAKARARWGAFPLLSYDSELWQADMKKTFSAFAWRPETSLEEGLRRVVAHLA